MNEKPVSVTAKTDSKKAINEQDKITDIFTAVRDTGRSLQADDALLHSEERLRLALMATEQGLYDHDFHTGRTTFSPEYAHMLGYEPHELQGTFTEARERIHPDDYDRIDRMYREYLSGERDSHYEEIRERSKSGEWLWVLSIGKVVEWDKHRKPVRLVGTTANVTVRKRHEQVLQERAELQSRLSKIASIAPVAVHEFRLGADGRMSMPYSTPAILEIYGIAPEDLKEDFSSAWELIHPDDRAIIQPVMEESARTLEPFHCEWRVRHPLKGEIWVDCRSTPVAQPDGSVIWYGYFHDVTERKRAEELLHNREQEFRAFVENSPDLILRFDREFRETYVNPAVSRVFGIPADAFIGKPVGQAASEAGFAGTAEGLALVREKIAVVFQSGEATELEIPWPTPQGNRIFSVRYFPELDRNGKVMSVIAIARDITELKDTELQLRTLVENLPDFVARFDKDGHHIFVNPSITKAFGVPQETFLGKTIGELKLDPEDTLLNSIRQAFAEGLPNTLENKWQTPWGERTFDIRHIPERDESGRITSVLGIARDITERKRAEQERLDHLRFFECMDKVNRAIQGTNDLAQMMGDVLDIVLAIFDCDRAWLLYPCDPDTTSWRVPMERTRPEYPGALAQDIEIPVDPEVLRVFHTVRSSGSPVQFGPGSKYPLPVNAAKRFNIQSQIAMALYPKAGKLWMFGLHQCSYPRVWKPDEERLFQEIGRRLEDALTGLLAHRDLQESEQRLHLFRALLDRTNDSIEVIDPETGRFLDVNERACQDHGYTREEYLELSVPDIETGIDLTSSELWRRKVEEIRKRGSMLLEGEHRRKDGSVFPVEVNVNYIHLDRDYLVAVVRDITERKRTEEILRHNEADLQLALDAGRLGTWKWNILTGEITWSAHCKALYGLPADASVSYELFLAIVHPDDRERIDAALKQAVETRTDYDVEKRIIWPDGSIHWNTSRAQVFCNATGEPTLMAGITMDITERKRADQELSLMNFALNHVGEAAYLIDKNFKFTYVNDESCGALGYSRGELLNLGVTDIDPDFPMEHLLELQRKLEARGSLTFETRHQAKDGRIFPVEINANYFKYDGRGYHLALVRDITERKLAEEARHEAEAALRANVARLAQQESALIEIIQHETTHESDEAAILHCITEASARTLGIARASIWRFTPDRKFIRCLDLFEWHENRHSAGMELAAASYPAYFEALAVSEVITADDAQADPRTREFSNDYLKPLGISSMMDAPIRLHGIVAGVICQEQVGPPRAWTPDERAFTIALANHVALAFEEWESSQTQTALQESEERFRLAFESAGTGMALLSLGGRWLRVNHNICEMLGYTEDEMRQTTYQELTHPDDLLRGQNDARRLVTGEIPYLQIEKRYRHRDGHFVWARLTTSVARSGQGEPLYYVSQIENITERKLAEQARREAEAALRESDERFRQMAENIQEIFWLTDIRKSQMLYVSPAYETIWGRPCDSLYAEPLQWIEAVHPDDRLRVGNAALTLQGAGDYDLEYRIIRPDGTVRYIHDRAFPIRDASGTVYRVVGIAQDVTARKEQEAHIQYLAYHDALTGLPNRALVMNRLDQALAQAQRHKQMLAVLFVDLDRFKTINDTLGHPAGDTLLQQAGVCLADILREEDTVGRVGGDEFLILIPGLATAEDAAHVTGKIHESLSAPFKVAGHELHVTASIGISLYPRDTDEAETLVKYADTALYLAKEQGRNTFRFFSPELDAKVRARLHMENDLRHAIDRNELLLHYQPQMNLATGKLTGAETLLRWQHPVHGLISPVDFISIAEETGLIIPIGEWVLRSAGAQARAWQAAGISEFRVSVNLSGRQLEQTDLAATVRLVLKETGCDPHLLEMEITESSIMNQPEQAIVKLQALHEMGIQLALDDFGTGYSSLAYLKRFPLDRLKIDRSFVEGIPADNDDMAIVQTTIVLARQLRLKVVAEGVETEAQQVFLKANGCDEMQGYLLSKPLAARDLEKLCGFPVSP